MIRVAVNYNPRLSKVEQQMIALPERIKNLRPLMKQGIAPLADQMLLRHWESKGAAFGHAWAPLAESTVITKRRKGTLGKGILRDTDHLFKALFRNRTADNRLQAIKGGLRLQLNTGIPYAIFHQLGTIHMPMRQVIPDPLPRSFINQVRAVIRNYLLTGAIPNAG